MDILLCFDIMGKRDHFCSKPSRNAVPDFLRLADALSALYPKEREGERLLDAMFLAMPR